MPGEGRENPPPVSPGGVSCLGARGVLIERGDADGVWQQLILENEDSISSNVGST